jgi:hypothetical protein
MPSRSPVINALPSPRVFSLLVIFSTSHSEKRQETIHISVTKAAFRPK